MGLLRRFVAFIVRLLMWLRYDIEIRGAQTPQQESDGGVLILPNHPGELDPAIVLAHLWNRYQPHPVAVDDFYYMRGVRLMMKMVGAIPMPNTDGGIGSYKRVRVRKTLDHAASCLDEGQNILMYPSGQMMRSGLEHLRGASGTYDILSRVKEKKILLVRTRGLIGSSFSWVAWQGRPPLLRLLLQSLKYILMNLILFMPRRKVVVELVEAPADFPYNGDKMEMNRYLEAWFNEQGEEEISLVPFTFWSKKCFQPRQIETIDTTRADIPGEIRAQVANELAGRSIHDADDIQDSWNLASDFGFDSLETAQLVAWLQEEFHAFDVKPEELRTVHDVQVAAVGASNTNVVDAKVPAPKGWEELQRKLSIQPPDTELSVHMNFLMLCQRGGNAVAMADEAGGVISYKRLKISALILADIIREYPEKNVGIMLPASGGAAIVIMATLLAGKVPVMVNWTVGDANIEHVLRVGETNVILTSERFLDRLDSIDFERIADRVVTLESLRNDKITLGRKLRAVWHARRRPESICQRFGSHATVKSDTGVILFTSGSEAAPKGVPLSHYNLLSNICGCLDAVSPGENDVLYGFLPPFHSFGFTLTTLLPLTTGFKVAFYPNPTDARALARGIAMWEPTMVCGTPTFIAGIFRSASDAQLRSIRRVMTAGEATPAELFETARKRFDADLLEGYGITECSPVLTLCRPGQGSVGVGPAIKDVELRMVHPETRENTAIGEQGLIVAAGPNVFSGYLDTDSTDAFMMIDGKSYYITGDLGILDSTGSLTLTGRLKRFVKIGGEMISLPAMEAVIQQKLFDDDEEATAALTYIEEAGERPIICLFTSTDVDVETVNGHLREAGLSNLTRVRKVVQIDEMPLLGTGKTNYRELTQRLKAAM
jgi:acyl-CoA synthetase (AMP-forming)/AMP-acid ligase II/1-acyl-sn-glycerol-3-phosphate acyltransferase/acyl carrier protein